MVWRRSRQWIVIAFLFVGFGIKVFIASFLGGGGGGGMGQLGGRGTA